VFADNCFRARASYRKAQIEAKRNAEAARRQEREILLGKADGKRRLRGANQLSYVACSSEAWVTADFQQTGGACPQCIQ